MSDLVCETNWEIAGLAAATNQIKAMVKNEEGRVTGLAAELVDPDDAGTHAKIARGKELAGKAESGFTPGRVRPHLLFKYAAERSLFEDILIRTGKRAI